MPNVTPPPLAVYKAITEWIPKYSDFVVWKKWFRTSYGVVSDFNATAGQVSIIFENTPRLLFTMTEQEMKAQTLVFDVNDVRNWKVGRWYAQQNGSGNVIWFI
jgi:hypothetical protein